MSELEQARHCIQMQQSEAKNRSTDKSVANLLGDFLATAAPDTNQLSQSGKSVASLDSAIPGIMGCADVMEGKVRESRRCMALSAIAGTEILSEVQGPSLEYPHGYHFYLAKPNGEDDR